MGLFFPITKTTISPLDPRFGGYIGGGADASGVINAAVAYAIANNLALDLRGAPNGSWWIKKSIWLMNPTTGATVSSVICDDTGVLSAAPTGTFYCGCAVLVGDPMQDALVTTGEATYCSIIGQMRIYSNSRTSTNCPNGIYIKGYNLSNPANIYAYDFPGSGIILDSVYDSWFGRLVADHCGSFTTFTGAIAATTATSTSWSISATGVLTIGGTITGSFLPGSLLTGTGVAAKCLIESQLTGTAGGAGTYQTSIISAVAGSGTLTASYGLMTASSPVGNPLGVGNTVYGAGVTAGTVITYASGSTYVVYPSQAVASEAMTAGSYAFWCGSNWLRFGSTDSTNCLHIVSAACIFANQFAAYFANLYRMKVSDFHGEQCQVVSTNDGTSTASGATYNNYFFGGTLNDVSFDRFQMDALLGTVGTTLNQDGTMTIAATALNIVLNGGTNVDYNCFDMIGDQSAGANVYTYSGTGNSALTLRNSQAYNYYQTGLTGVSLYENFVIKNNCEAKLNCTFTGCTIGTLQNYSLAQQLRFYGGQITTVSMTNAIDGDISFNGVNITTVNQVGSGAASGVYQKPSFNDCNVGTLNLASGTAASLFGGYVQTMQAVAGSLVDFHGTGFNNFSPATTNYTTDGGCYCVGTVSSWGVPTVSYPAGARTSRLGSYSAGANNYINTAAGANWTALN